jgi:hypothetical protein
LLWLPKLHQYPYHHLSFPKLQTYLRFQPDTVLKPLHTKPIHCLFTHCQSLPNFCHTRLRLSITVCSPEQLDISYTWMPSPIYQNMVNFIGFLYYQ